MKTLKRIRLSDLSNAEMANSEMNQLRGGGDPGYCGCGCQYKDKGGANTVDNFNANVASGYTSEGGSKQCSSPYDANLDDGGEGAALEVLVR